jgi:hypothetical protein
MRALATARPTSRRSRLSSAFRASSSTRGMLTISDALTLTARLPALGLRASMASPERPSLGRLRLPHTCGRDGQPRVPQGH